MSPKSASSLAEVMPQPLTAEPEAGTVTQLRPERDTAILLKPQWIHARVPMEGVTVSGSDSAVTVSGPRPSVETFLSRAGVHLATVLDDSPLSPDTERLRKRFNKLANQWERESLNLSSATEMAMLSSYQQIIGLGPDAVPLVLQRLREEPDMWFWALRAMTGANPVLREHIGRVRDMADDWLRWGRRKGVLA